jgi:hypothetical protein
MQAYPGTEVLVGFDPDFDYGENFFVCLTEEAKSQLLQVSLDDCCGRSCSSCSSTSTFNSTCENNLVF